MRPHAAVILLPVLAFTALHGAGAAEPSPLGQWELASGESRYSVSRCGGEALCARLVWLRDDARTEENLALLDTYVVKGARPAENGGWAGTVTFDGSEYAGTMQVQEDGRMEVRSCSGLLCRSFTLRRI